MRRDDVIRLLREHWDEICRHSVKHLSLFGSVARDDARADSDIDVLVEFEGAATFDHYTGLLAYLEDLFGRRIDLLTPRSIKPRVRDLIAREMVLVA